LLLLRLRDRNPEQAGGAEVLLVVRCGALALTGGRTFALSARSFLATVVGGSPTAFAARHLKPSISRDGDKPANCSRPAYPQKTRAATGTHRGHGPDLGFIYMSPEPDDVGLLWTVSLGESLPAGMPVAAFNEAPNCCKRLPVDRGLVVAGGNLFLYELFGNRNKGARHCEGLPGGAWMLDPATGRFTRQVATELHFNGLIADPAELVLYGIALGGDNSPGSQNNSSG
jgi:hypothetical protein